MKLSNQSINSKLEPLAKNVWFKDSYFCVDLEDGRTLMIPLSFYPVLEKASPEERNDWRIFLGGGAIHFNKLDADLEVLALIEGRKQIGVE